MPASDLLTAENTMTRPPLTRRNVTAALIALPAVWTGGLPLTATLAGAA